MKHRAIPFERQCNPGVDRSDPTAEKTAIELQFPSTFSARAWRVIRYLSGAIYLYSYKGRYVATDESLELSKYGDGTPGSPYGYPRWVGDSLEELEWWLESIADDYDAMGNIPGWKVLKAPLSLSAWLKNDVLVTMSADKEFVGIKTYDRKHGSRGRFLISRSTISELLEASKTTKYESDCGDYAKITRLDSQLLFSFTWLNYDGSGNVMGFRQDVTIPVFKLYLALEWAESVKHLYIPQAAHAKIDARPAASTIRKVVKEKRVRRAFSKAMRDCFCWAGDTVTLYKEGEESFFFTTSSGYPKCGGLILHGGSKDGHPYIYYSVHT